MALWVGTESNGSPSVMFGQGTNVTGCENFVTMVFYITTMSYSLPRAELDILSKRILAATLKLSEEDADLFRKAGEALYGKGHPVPRSTVIRELALRAARQLVKTRPKR